MRLRAHHDAALRTRRSGVGAALVPAGAALLLAALWLPWSARGAGSSMTGRELADLLLSGRLDRWVPRWTGALLYAPALAAGVLLVTAALGSPGARRVAWAACATCLVVLAAAAWLVAASRTLRGIGAGLGVTALGTMLVTAGTALSRRTGTALSRRRR